MARKVFFSFHYDRDIRRVVQIRNSWRIRAGNETQPFLDKAEWESIRRTSASAVENWIEKQLSGTSVTVVLIGSQTFNREWVKHEIRRSHELGKGILGIYIHNVRDPQLGTDQRGKNPLEHWSASAHGREIPFTKLYNTYDWVNDNGFTNFAAWIEKAAREAGR
jgi:hypothetical protein